MNTATPSRSPSPVLMMALLLIAGVVSAMVFFRNREGVPSHLGSSDSINERSRTVVVGGVPRPGSDMKAYQTKRRASSGDGAHSRLVEPETL
jgi:hypothetical protein